MTLNWFVATQPGGTIQAVAQRCSDESNGAYTISVNLLPTTASDQREQLVRRLAARDSTVDLVGMDVIWTAEFANAGWIRPFPTSFEKQTTAHVFPSSKATAEFKGKLYGAPFNSNTQVLWYRKDKVDAPPEDFTWDEMIDDALAKKTHVEVQARQYEGLTVWVNALIAGAGGQIVNQAGDVKVDDTAKTAAEIISKLGKSAAAPPGMSTNAEDQARQGFEAGRSYYEVNYPFVYPSAAALGGDFQKNMGWALYPRTDKDKPSRPPLGGINIGVSKYSETPDLAFQAAECIANEKHQGDAAELGGLPPTTEAVYNTAQVKKAYPFADLLRQSIEAAAPRPVTPAYSDISLAIQKTYSPPDGIDPNGIVQQLKDRIEKAVEGKIF